MGTANLLLPESLPEALGLLCGGFFFLRSLLSPFLNAGFYPCDHLGPHVLGHESWVVG